MPRSARIALSGAGAGIVLLALTWYVAHYVGFARHADVAILSGFVQLGRPRLDRLTTFVADLCNPHEYVFLAVIPVIMALVRRRPHVAVMISIVLLAANETTQLLKPLLAAPRETVWWNPIDLASWPSGHATASMTLALMTVISAPARRRPAVAAAAAAFTIAVCYSFLELGWHYPSDVFGGYLVAGTWTLLGIAGLWIYQARRHGMTPERIRRRPAAFSIREALAPTAALLLAAACAVALIALARPAPVLAYAREHTAFLIGASAIGAAGLMLASGLALMLRRG